jgi:hypothetical protein
MSLEPVNEMQNCMDGMNSAVVVALEIFEA